MRLWNRNCDVMPLVLMIIGGLMAAPCLAGPYDPPAGYYNPATGTGATLKQQLHDLIDNHTVHSYDDARFSLQVTDRDPQNASRILLIYNRASVNAEWDTSPLVWNREHTWPSSVGLGSGGPDYSDLHNLRPADPDINSRRGNTPFGGAYPRTSYGEVSESGNTYWYPGNADAGMVARQMFYMAVRYDGSDSGTTNIELVNGPGNDANGTLGNLARLLEWHYSVTPDAFEQRRNHVIYTSYQGNRNPFIDRPELVWSVFADQQNDTRLSVAPLSGGNTVNADGSSSLGLSSAAVYVNGTPASASFRVDKAGVDGTYYALNATGDFTFTGDARAAFAMNTTGSRTVATAFTGSTATAGLRTGTIKVDNLDVTTQGGAGRGANDADDAVSLSLNVLDHGRASFNSTVQQTSASIDLGIVALGDASVGTTFSAFNLARTAGFTGNVILASPVQLSAADARLSLLGDPGVLTAGASISMQAWLNPLSLGSASGQWRVNVTEPALAGSIDPTDLLISVNATVALAGDTDLDGDVDLDDAQALRLAFTGTLAAGQGAAIWQMGDFDRDRDVDFADAMRLYLGWTSDAARPDLASIPEPAMVLPAFMLHVCVRRRRALRC